MQLPPSFVPGALGGLLVLTACSISEPSDEGAAGAIQPASKALVVTLRQTQPDAWGLYRLPGYELLIDGLLVRVEVDGRVSTYTFDQFTGPAKSIEADPNGWWLHESTVKGEE